MRYSFLEQELEAEGHLPLSVAIFTGDRSERAVGRLGVWNAELNIIERVVAFHSEL